MRFVSSAHSMVFMKGLLDYFAQPPFGYTGSDTRWLLGKLFRDGKISATVDREPIFLCKHKIEKR